MDNYLIEFSPEDIDIAAQTEVSADESLWERLCDDLVLRMEIEELVVNRYRELAGLIDDDGENDDEQDD